MPAPFLTLAALKMGVADYGILTKPHSVGYCQQTFRWRKSSCPAYTSPFKPALRKTNITIISIFCHHGCLLDLTAPTRGLRTPGALRSGIVRREIRRPFRATKETYENNIMSKNLKIIPLGGLGEIGKNMTLLEYGRNQIIVDCGVMFPESDMYGIDLVLPDFDYVVENQEPYAELCSHMGIWITLAACPIF